METRLSKHFLAHFLTLALFILTTTAALAGASGTTGTDNGSSTPKAAGANRQSPEDKLLDQVKGHPLAKLGPWLINLYEEYEQFAAASNGHGQQATFHTRNPLLRVRDGMIAIDGVMNNPAALRRTLRSVGATDVRDDGILFSARVPVSSLGKLGRDPALRSAAPVLAKTQALQKPVISQGVQSLFGMNGPDDTGADGSGVRVGVLSDSFGCEPGPLLPGQPTSTVAEDKATGELSNDIVVASDSCPGNIDEGRAILQIIHDVAPGATGAFHTAFNGRFDFACGIMELGGIASAGAANACGAFGVGYSPLTGGDRSDIIDDDVIYFAEPMFMPGAVAQAANTVHDAGIPYFSSAGNQGRASYEDDYNEVVDNGNFGNNLNRGAAPGPNAIHVQDFGGGDTTQGITMVQSGGSSFFVVSFQWNQPHFSSTAFGTLLNGGTIQDALGAPGASTDMDLLFYDENGILVPLCPPGVAAGITCQITGTNNLATGDAVDIAALFFTGPKRVGHFQIRLVRSAGSDDLTRVKYVAFQESGATIIDEFDTRSGTAYGHANAAGAASVGAAAWYATLAWKDNPADDPFDLYLDSSGDPLCDPACAEDFSSAGGIPIFFDGEGNPITPFTPENPLVTGPDGGNSTFFVSDSSFDDDDGDHLNNPFSTFITPLDPDPASEWPNFFGTSASAPHVAALAARMLSKNPGLTPDDIYGILKNTAIDMSKRFTNFVDANGDPAAHIFPVQNPSGFDYDTGWGFVDGDAAVSAAAPPP